MRISAAPRKISPAMMSAEMKYFPRSYSSPTRSMPPRHSSMRSSGSSPASSRRRMASRLPRSSILTMSSARLFSLCGVVISSTSFPAGADDADRRGEGQAIGSADEPAPALGAVVEVIEEMLDDPGKRPRVLAETRRFLLREGGRVQREAAVLEPRAAGPGEQVLQRGHAELGLD